ncbi:MAG: YihY/virulence factor BrkB family protein, partial [Anaerolineales bacterium]|nr:YihY/virulence factor BrkB family protein [Anaerolineales bacterium]
MTSRKLPKYMTELWQQVIHAAHALNDRTNGWLGMLGTALKKTLMPDTGVMASSIAYIALFSLFPLILLSISIASFSFGPSIDQQVTIERLEFVAPALGQLLGQNIDAIIRTRGPVTSFALLGLVWSASTIFNTLTYTLSKIWQMRQSRAAWKRRGMSMLFVMAFVGPTLFLISFAGSVIANIRFWLPDLILPFWYGISLILTIPLDIILFMVLYMLFPHGTSTWREILPGAVGAGVLWELAKKAFLSFVATYISISNLIYGSLAAIIAFLLWAYISSLIFIFGAYLSVSYWELKEKQK